MYLLLCLPQLLDWRKGRDAGNTGSAGIAQAVLVAILLALWLNGNAIFLVVPQLAEWALFFALTMIVALNLLARAGALRVQPEKKRRM